MLPDFKLSKSQIDRLGDRLRKSSVDNKDLIHLERYRSSFTETYDYVVRRLFDELGFLATGRPAKSTKSIIEKLRRESIRLSQIQDIAGCRLVVDGVTAQDDAVVNVVGLFDHTSMVDRRKEPSHGYRAVHVIVDHIGKPVEVRIRTSLQHRWAELSEKISDVINPGIKYGQPEMGSLLYSSQSFLEYESAERKFAYFSSVPKDTESAKRVEQLLLEYEEHLAILKEINVKLLDDLREAIAKLEE